jgi:hypothetical protein
MWTRDAAAMSMCKIAKPDLRIFEEKKQGECAAPPRSSLSKYALLPLDFEAGA